MSKMPKGFDRDMKSVPILKAKDAFDLFNYNERDLMDILTYIVDGEGNMVPWKLANLLDQSTNSLGYFEQIPGIDFEEGD